jgi:hypothetical protein
VNSVSPLLRASEWVSGKTSAIVSRDAKTLLLSN